MKTRERRLLGAVTLTAAFAAAITLELSGIELVSFRQRVSPPSVEENVAVHWTMFVLVPASVVGVVWILLPPRKRRDGMTDGT